MKKSAAGCLAILTVLFSALSMMAHHSLGNYDTTKAVRVTGTIVQFNQINPHSLLYLDEKGATGHRWAVEGPSILQLTRSGFAKDALKAGDVVEICGYVPKEPIVWQIANPDSNAASMAGRLINGELLIMPDGTERSWGDYGVHKCFAPGFTDQHSK